MDYDKKYKDALEKAKEVYNRKDATDGDKLILESMFPELKESEDEKMREMAIKAVYAPEAQSCIKSWGVNPDDVIAWLKNHSDTYDYTRVDLSKFDDRIQEFSDMLEDKPKSYWDGFYEAMDWVRINGNPFKEKQGKQKSTKNIMNVWKDMRFEVYQQATGNRHEPNYSDDTTKMFSLNDIDEIIEKMSEQKPIISNNALREGIAHFGITQYQIDNWLKKYVDVEKQGEQILNNSAKTCKDGYSPKFRVGDTIKCKYDDRQFTIKSVDFNKGTYTYTQEGCGNDIDYADEEFELVEQKPAYKAQLKFKVGDWITNSIETVQITGYDIDYGYQVDYKGNLQHRDTDIIEKEYHLWTIQDAKDGDVLVDNYAIIIFRKIGNYVLDDVVDFYICYSFEKGVIIQRHNLHCGFIDSVFFKPATKEQRDMFFQKMHEAGYEWDFEVKELNKIEKKPACSEEEKQLLFKDLCARLPYKVRCKCVSGLGGGETEKGVLKYVGNCYGVISNYYEDVPLHSGFVNNVFYPIENVKPYLRPMSSMTEEERKMVCTMNALSEVELDDRIKYRKMYVNSYTIETFDLLNSNHLDYRGLIPMGLAIKVTEENNPYKE